MDFVILGATGHVGNAVAHALLDRGAGVIAVTRTAAHAADLAERGARIAEADLTDTPRLRAVLGMGRRAFLLNPPADPATDTDAAERRTAEAIARALEGSDLDRVVAQSTWGTRPERGFGDLSTLHHFETLLRPQSIPVTILRATYLMSNWDAPLAAAQGSGRLATMLPCDLSLPMIAPQDLGRIAADLLLADSHTDGPVHAEGPARYSPQDVADAASALWHRPVICDATPRDGWIAAFRDMGFSDAAARSYAAMTGATVDAEIATPPATVKGTRTLADHIRERP